MWLSICIAHDARTVRSHAFNITLLHDDLDVIDWFSVERFFIFSMFLSLSKSLKWAYYFGWYVASNDWSEVLLIVFSIRLLIWWSFWMIVNFQVDLFYEKFTSAFFCNRVISFEQHLIVKGDNFVQRTSGHTIIENNSIAVVLEERAIRVLHHLQVEVTDAMLIGLPSVTAAPSSCPAPMIQWSESVSSITLESSSCWSQHYGKIEKQLSLNRFDVQNMSTIVFCRNRIATCLWHGTWICSIPLSSTAVFSEVSIRCVICIKLLDRLHRACLFSFLNRYIIFLYKWTSLHFHFLLANAGSGRHCLSQIGP